MSNKIVLLPKQKQFFDLNTREALLEAGIAYGKSRVASIWLICMTQQYAGTKWLMAASNYKQLKSAVDAEFEYYLHDIFKLERNVHYRKTNGSPIHYVFLNNGSEIYGHSAVNYETAFRAGNYSGGWGDEMDFWKAEAVERFRGRIRVYPEKVRWTSSPFGYNHVHEDFYVKKMGPVINATTLENPFVSDEYKESLKQSYSEKLYRQEVLAERLNITQGNIYFEFNRDLNVKECSKINGYPVWFGCDFNNNPLTGVIGQVIDNTLYIFDEYYNDSGQAKTETMSQWVYSKYGKTNAVPDSTGKKATTNANFSDLAILRQLHNVMPAPNPFRIDRYNAVNTRLSQSKIVISPKCIHTIKDLERVSYKAGTNQPEVSDSTLTHISDGLGYLVYKTINPFSLSRRGGVSNL